MSNQAIKGSGVTIKLRAVLSLEVFQKKTQQTPKANIKLAEQRLADWRRRGKAKRASQEN